MIKYLALSFLVRLVLSLPSCEIGKNFCSKCHPLTNLCVLCENEDVLSPNEDGGCSGSKICEIGSNYCEECNQKKTLCDTCSIGYFPDQNGGCSYSDNCKVSYLGGCLECKKGFILLKELKICKSLELDDYKYCEEIDYSTGYCKTCEEDYYLSKERKCTNTPYCEVSIYGKCVSCEYAYYLDVKDGGKCKYQYDNQNFLHCSRTEDGKSCSKCSFWYYLDEDGKCVNTNYCSNSKNFICEKCLPDYYLSDDKKSCVTTKNCKQGDGDTGVCDSCLTHFYFDATDGFCKSNLEDNDLKYCKFFKEKCLSCDSSYVLGKDSKCSNSKNCAESENGVCEKCIEDYYLGKDNKCSKIKHCIYSDYSYNCQECEDGYVLNKKLEKCEREDEDFENCKVKNTYNGEFCDECKNDYYLLSTDKLCYSNKKEGPFYKCAKTNVNGTECTKCKSNYYLGSIDKKCSKISNCARTEDGKCQECEANYCLNAKTGECEYNVLIKEERQKILYRCNRTNEEATECEICSENYQLDDNGYCVDMLNCEEEKKGRCIKCKEDGDRYPFFLCANKEFGCVENYMNENCSRCDNSFNFDNCTECKEGYELVENEDYKGQFICKEISD